MLEILRTYAIHIMRGIRRLKIFIKTSHSVKITYLTRVNTTVLFTGIPMFVLTFKEMLR